MGNVERLADRIALIVGHHIDADIYADALKACGLEVNPKGTAEVLHELSYCSVKIEPLVHSFDLEAHLPDGLGSRYEAAIMGAILLNRVEPTDADRAWAEETMRAIEARRASLTGEDG